MSQRRASRRDGTDAHAASASNGRTWSGRDPPSQSAAEGRALGRRRSASPSSAPRHGGGGGGAGAGAGGGAGGHSDGDEDTGDEGDQGGPLAFSQAPSQVEVFASQQYDLAEDTRPTEIKKWQGLGKQTRRDIVKEAVRYFLLRSCATDTVIKFTQFRAEMKRKFPIVAGVSSTLRSCVLPVVQRQLRQLFALDVVAAERTMVQESGKKSSAGGAGRGRGRPAVKSEAQLGGALPDVYMLRSVLGDAGMHKMVYAVEEAKPAEKALLMVVLGTIMCSSGRIRESKLYESLVELDARFDEPVHPDFGHWRTIIEKKFVTSGFLMRNKERTSASQASGEDTFELRPGPRARSEIGLHDVGASVLQASRVQVSDAELNVWVGKANNTANLDGVVVADKESMPPPEARDRVRASASQGGRPKRARRSRG